MFTKRNDREHSLLKGNATLVYLTAILLAGILLSMTSACTPGGETEPAVPPDSLAQSEEAPDDQHAYEVFIEGALQDTLRGEAAFGIVVNSNSGRRSFVIELRTASSLSGGLYLVRQDTLVPEQGTYELANVSDTTSRPPGQFALIYREGMRRALSSYQGTLEITQSSDSLLVGSLDAELRGRIKEEANIAAGEDRQDGTEQVQLWGEFRAESGEVGYLVGL